MKLDTRWELAEEEVPNGTRGGMTVYNFLLDNAVKLGLSPTELVLLFQIARFCYNGPNGCASPSISRLAELMGFSTRYITEMCQSLCKRGLLGIEYRPYRTSVYHLGPFSRACLELEKGRAKHR